MLVPYALVAASPRVEPAVSFARNVQPILRAHCISCHGSALKSAKLDLSSEAGLKRGGRSGSLIAPGHPDKSLLLQRIKGIDGDQMPLGMAPLGTADQKVIETWIAQGAVYDHAASSVHWAYLAPTKPALPAKKTDWVRNPIDLFVNSELETRGLSPQRRASRATLIRRVTLDLTGLPPTPAEVAEFLVDRSDAPYAKVVDRLLASPHFGERQARMWLDLARYADSDGYEKDLNRVAWKYRDWVIEAFNQNISYDQFTIKQLAGDLLPNATLADRIATGFHRNTMVNREGGVNAEEAHFAVIEDRAETTSSVWLGSTLACAKCHDHKYDPFSQKDYYAMVAFFNRSNVNRGAIWNEPVMPCPTLAQSQRLAVLTVTLASAQSTLALEAIKRYPPWLETAKNNQWDLALMPTSATSSNGQTLTIRQDGTIMVTGKNPESDTYTVTLPAGEAKITAIRLDVLSDPSLPSSGPGRNQNGNFALNKVALLDGAVPLPISAADADFSQEGFPASSVLAPTEKSGWAVNGGIGKNHSLVLTLAKPMINNGSIIAKFTFSGFDFHNLGKFRLVAMTSPEPALYLMPKLTELANKGSRTPAEEKLLMEYFRKHGQSLAASRQNTENLTRQFDELKASIPGALVMEEAKGNEPRKEWVRNRGEFQTKVAQVESAPPAIMNKGFAAGANRLSLAKWLVQPTNPLTARVEVNRLWEQYFGRGLVETSEDFGTRCTPPSHPELLDWLAVTFAEKRWDMKAMHRLIVTSATYMQDSAASPLSMQTDPQNRLLSRGPRFRMEAEMIHDNALAIAGLLSGKVGGPSVYPSQPDGTWNTPANDETWMTSTGQDRYRRGIYTFWKRTSPYPSFLTFDATSRENCTIRRTRTNTPLQALAIMNDQLMMEASRGLARRMTKAGVSSLERISRGVLLCLARSPSEKELTILTNLLATLNREYVAKPKEAAKFGGVESASYTMLANVLLNLDETLTKE